MSTCEHKTTIVKYDQGNVQVEVCTWGCGQTIISVKRADAITESFTAAELYSLAGNIAAITERVGRLEAIAKKHAFRHVLDGDTTFTYMRCNSCNGDNWTGGGNNLNPDEITHDNGCVVAAALQEAQ